MNIKEGLEYYAEKYKFPRYPEKVEKICRPNNEGEPLVLKWNNKGYEYWFSGTKILWRNVKTVACVGKCKSVPKAIRDMFKELKRECIENKG